LDGQAHDGGIRNLQFSHDRTSSGVTGHQYT
jgi:hypothetical protein